MSNPEIKRCKLKDEVLEFSGTYSCGYSIIGDNFRTEELVGCFTVKGFWSFDDEEITGTLNPRLPGVTNFFELTQEFITDNYEQGSIADDCYYGDIDGREVLFYYGFVQFPEDVIGSAGEYMVEDTDGYYRAFSKEAFSLLFEEVLEPASSTLKEEYDKAQEYYDTHLRCGAKLQHTVFKLEDIEKYLTHIEKQVLELISQRISIGRLQDNKSDNEYFVINTDESYSGEIIEVLKRHGHWG